MAWFRRKRSPISSTDEVLVYDCIQWVNDNKLISAMLLLLLLLLLLRLLSVAAPVRQRAARAANFVFRDVRLFLVSTKLCAAKAIMFPRCPDVCPIAPMSRANIGIFSLRTNTERFR